MVWTAATEQAEIWTADTPESGRAFDGIFADTFSDDAFDVGQFWDPWVATTENTELWTATSEQAEVWTAVTKQSEGWAAADPNADMPVFSRHVFSRESYLAKQVFAT